MASSDAYAITYSTFLFIVVLVIAFVFGGGGAVKAVETGGTGIVRWVVSMLPYILLAWGFVVSFFTLELRHFIPTIVGGSALALSMAGQFIFGKFLPMFVASTSAILTYFTYDYMVEHRGDNPMKNILATTFSFLLLLAQVMTTKPAAPGTYLFGASLMNDGLGAMFGIAVGLSGWAIVSSSSPNALPYTGVRESSGTIVVSSPTPAPSSAR